MLKKLSKSRKKKMNSKSDLSQHKNPKDVCREPKQHHPMRAHTKTNHHASTFSLVSRHNASQCSLLSDHGDNKAKYPKDKKASNEGANREKSRNLKASKEAKPPKNVAKQSKDVAKSKKNSSAAHNDSNSKKLAKRQEQKPAQSQKQNSRKRQIKQEQLYERINIGLYKSKTNSEINFSNASSVRDSCPSQQRGKRTLTIDCSEQYILSQYVNTSGIRAHDKRRSEAAVKIQKVARGYLTRKMLQQFIDRQQRRLIEMSHQMRKSNARGQDPAIGELSSSVSGSFRSKPSEPDSYKRSRNIKMRSPDQEMHEVHSNKKYVFTLSCDGGAPNYEQAICAEEIDISLRDSRKQPLPLVDHAALLEQSSIYGHPQDSLSRYLPFEQKYDSIDQSYAMENQQSASIYNYGIKVDAVVEQKKAYDKVQKRASGREFEADYFRGTPALSSEASKTKDPIPTDFSDKRVEEFDYDVSKSREFQRTEQNTNFYKKNRNSYEFSPAAFPSNQLYLDCSRPPQAYPNKQSPALPYIEQHQDKNRERQLIALLRREQKSKWQAIIAMLSQQIVQSKTNSEQNERFMSMILQFSKKNKEQLEKSTFLKNKADHVINQEPERGKKTDKSVWEKDFILIKKKNKHEKTPQLIEKEGMVFNFSQAKQQIQAQKQRLSKNQDMPLIRKKLNNLNINLFSSHTPAVCSQKGEVSGSLLDKTEQLKNFFKRNHQTYSIEQIIEIRERALEKREKDMMNRLNEDLCRNALTHEEFIGRLAEMQSKFESERSAIQKAKVEIFVGHRATHRLMQDSVKDAWYLGFKVPFSQSMREFRTRCEGLWVRQLVVDELRDYASNPSKAPYHTDPDLHDGENMILQGYPRKVSENSKRGLRLEIDEKLDGRQESEKKKYDLSISIPHDDSSLTMKAHEVSQQSVYSEQISYNQGDIEIRNLENLPRNELFCSEESDECVEADKEAVEGFRKVNKDKLVRKALSSSREREFCLLVDPEEQEENDNQVMRKISINKVRSPEAHPDLEGLHRSALTPRSRGPSYPRSEIYKVDASSSEEQSGEEQIFNQEIDPEVREITEAQILRLVWEVVEEISLNKHIRFKFCRGHNKSPGKISQQEQLAFVGYLEQFTPSFQELLPKINQKMTASRLELLKFMRVSFQDESYDEPNAEQLQELSEGSRSIQTSEAFEEIGKFEHILSSDVCLNALNTFMEEQSKQHAHQSKLDEEKIAQIVQDSFRDKLSAEGLKKLTEREKMLVHNQTQKNELRKEIQKIQFHCIFDAFNQLIIKKRIRSTGYSGIGLNQLTLAISSDSLKKIQHKQSFVEMYQAAKKELHQLMSLDKSSSEKLLMENYESLCQNDSQWVYYTEEALSFALEFVYMLQDEIFFEETALIFKRLKKL